jgi:transaldolase
MHLIGIDRNMLTSSQAVLMCKKNIDSIQGRVLLQTLPSKAYDTQATLDHARLYDKEFARAGISRERFCIKIPSTGPALNAAKILSTEGIPTLGTALFSLAQAIACSQAGMLYISPYYNGTLDKKQKDYAINTELQKREPTMSYLFGQTSPTLRSSTRTLHASSRFLRHTNDFTKKAERSNPL